MKISRNAKYSVGKTFQLLASAASSCVTYKYTGSKKAALAVGGATFIVGELALRSMDLGWVTDEYLKLTLEAFKRDSDATVNIHNRDGSVVIYIKNKNEKEMKEDIKKAILSCDIKDAILNIDVH